MAMTSEQDVRERIDKRFSYVLGSAVDSLKMVTLLDIVEEEIDAIAAERSRRERLGDCRAL